MTTLCLFGCRKSSIPLDCGLNKYTSKQNLYLVFNKWLSVIILYSWNYKYHAIVNYSIKAGKQVHMTRMKCQTIPIDFALFLKQTQARFHSQPIVDHDPQQNPF